MITRKCAICGKEFQTSKNTQIYCSCTCNVQGQKANRKQRKANRQRRENEHLTTGKDRLTEIQRSAQAEGLSYGQYQAKRMLERMHQMSTKRRSDIESEGVNEKN